MKRTILFAVFGALIYAFSLLITAPARLADRIVPRPAFVEGLSGTIWNGRAAVSGGHRVDWRFDAMASLSAFALKYDVMMAGPTTQLRGGAAVDRNRIVLTDVSGRAGWALVAALAPDIPVACTPLASVDLSKVVLSRDLIGAEGTVLSTEGDCVNRDLPDLEPVTVPPLLARGRIEGSTASAILTTQAEETTPLAQVERTNDRWLKVTVQPEGARMVPGMPSSAPMTLEMEMEM